MDRKTVREVLGDSSTWSNAVTTGKEAPNLQDARIMDVFCVGKEISLLMHCDPDCEMLTVFRIPDAVLRERVLGALRPGELVIKALDATI